MGAGNSKPEGSSRHVFASETPVQFSQELVDSLQSSSEVSSVSLLHPIFSPNPPRPIIQPANHSMFELQTDSTRSKTFDLHVAQRVHAELEKISAREQTALEAITSKIQKSSSSSSPTTTAEPNLMSSILSSPSSTKDSKSDDISTSKVDASLAKLRKDLEGRKTVKELSPEVEKAREEVYGCLRRNDRTPLDCWREVEGFREAVGRMEGGWVEKVL